MERKTAQRIIGVLVIISFAIILLPLLFSNNKPVNQISAAKMQPPAKQAENNNTASTPERVVEIKNSLAETVTPIQPVRDTKQLMQQVKQEEVTKLPPAMTVDHPPTLVPLTSVAANQPINPPISANPADPDKATDANNNGWPTQNQANDKNKNATHNTNSALNPNQIQRQEQAPQQHSAVTPVKSSASSDPSIKVDPEANRLGDDKSEPNTRSVKLDADGFTISGANRQQQPAIHHQKKLAAKSSPSIKIMHAQIKHKTARDNNWVVQLGAFKNQANAKRLVNKLRAQGYHAFTHEVGSTLRVYVPAADKNTAKQLAQKTEIRGVIVAYDPMDI